MNASYRSVAAVGLAWGLVSAAAGCGDDDDAAADASSGVELVFVDQFGSSALNCSQVGGASTIVIDLFAPDGTTARLGYPQTFGCTGDRVRLFSLPEGNHIIEVTFQGQLGLEANAPLYRGRQAISAPSIGPIIVRLGSLFGTLTLAWTFGDASPSPCTDEVGAIDVTLVPLTRPVGTYEGVFDCDATPVEVPGRLAALAYLISLQARSRTTNAILYEHAATRIFVPGNNDYLALLEPSGGRITLDWRFAVGAEELIACDGPAVDVDEVSVVVESTSRVDRIDVPCTSGPILFNARRYPPEAEVTATLAAEGVHRFEGGRTFVMPEGDFDAGQLVLHAVGTATLAVDVTTPACAQAVVDGYDVSIAGPTDFGDQLESLVPDHPTAALAGLRYGAYEIEVAQRLADDETGCRVSGIRQVQERANHWAPFEL